MLPNTGLNRSRDGGKTFAVLKGDRAAMTITIVVDPMSRTHDFRE